MTNKYFREFEIMKKITLSEQRQIELDILKAIDSFCRTRGIQYMLSAGTLLGAIRHKGFIPWDDDIDIVMPRRDYERFFRTFNNETEEKNLRLISYRDKTLVYPFLKVIDKRTVVVEDFINPKFGQTGVWVDIFPIDGIPKNKKVYKLFRFYKHVHEVAVSDPNSASTNFRRIVKRILRVVLGNPDPYSVSSLYDEKAKSYPIEEGKPIGVLVWGYGKKEIMPYSYLETVEVEFEGHSFFASKMWDTYLTQLYGDYMKLPPIEDRKGHRANAYLKE